MSSASIWTPGSNNIPVADPNAQIAVEEFTATAGQTDFTISNFVYTLASNALEVHVNGVTVPRSEVTELSTTSFRIPACEGGDIVEVVGNIEAVDAEGQAIAAAASATAALASETAAATSAASAATSATNAANSATAAATSATNAATSATSAATSAATATTQATNAAASASAASTSETNAATSATNAATSATTATTQATNAANSASAASTSATNASNSATAAAGSETNAGTSETNAAASAASAAMVLANASFRNKIIGGDFTTNPWQRGTSFAIADNAATYTADRFVMYENTDGAVSVLKTADAPTVAQAGVFTQHCLHVDCTTADAAIDAGQTAFIYQYVEGLNALPFGFGQAGTRYVTLSFWHKHTKTGVYCACILNSAGSRSYIAEYTQAVTDTWELATITIPVDTTGTWLYDTGIGMRVYFVLAAGSTFHGAAGAWTTGAFATANQVNALDSISNNFKIALVQLEAGQVATPFETRSVGQELALCQRYYYRYAPGAANVSFAVGLVDTATSVIAETPFPVTMRVAPTALEQQGVATNYAVRTTAGATVCSAVPTFGIAGTQSANTTFTVAAGLTAGQAAIARTAVATTAGYLGWSAEL